MNQILTAILSIIITALGTVITTVLLPALCNWLKAKTQSQRLQSVIDDITITVQSSVDMLEQTVVKQLKEEDSWNATSQAQVLESAVIEIMTNLSNQTVDILKSEGANIESLIKRHIEAYIQSKKNSPEVILCE